MKATLRCLGLLVLMFTLFLGVGIVIWLLAIGVAFLFQALSTGWPAI